MIGVESLREFLHARVRTPDTHLQVGFPESRDLLGKIERALEARPDVDSIELTGLDQDSFEAFVATYGGRFRGIGLFKCPRLPDLSPLQDLADLEYLSIYWNQRAESLWGMTGNPALRGVSFRDFTRLNHLDDLTAAPGLEEVEFGDAIWNNFVVETLEPLARCPGLRTLTFSAKRITDGRIEPLAEIPRLSELQFPGNLFMTEQVAWLTARRGDHVRSTVLAPFWTIESPITIDGKCKDTFIVGKRKPFLSSRDDAARIERYVERFEAMVAGYAADPTLAPPKIRIAKRKPKKSR